MIAVISSIDPQSPVFAANLQERLSRVTERGSMAAAFAGGPSHRPGRRAAPGRSGVPARRRARRRLSGRRAPQLACSQGALVRHYGVSCSEADCRTGPSSSQSEDIAQRFHLPLVQAACCGFRGWRILARSVLRCRSVAPRTRQQHDLAQAALVRPRMGTTSLKALPKAEGTPASCSRPRVKEWGSHDSLRGASWHGRQHPCHTVRTAPRRVRPKDHREGANRR